MRRLIGALVLSASALGACATTQVATTPNLPPATTHTDSVTPTVPPSTPTQASTAGATTASPTVSPTAAATTAPSTAAPQPSPTAALAAENITPTPTAFVVTPAPTTVTVTPTPPPATAAPTVNPTLPRPMVTLVHSADNYMHVQFDRAMRQSGTGAANVLSSYQLDGRPLPAGSTIVCGSPSCDVVRIDMPENLPRGSAHTMRVAGVVGANGAPLDPDPTFTFFRTDTQSETP